MKMVENNRGEISLSHHNDLPSNIFQDDPNMLNKTQSARPFGGTLQNAIGQKTLPIIGLKGNAATLGILKAKLNEQREMKKQCRCVKLQEVQVKDSIEELKGEIAKSKASRLMVRAEIRQLKSQLKEMDAKDPQNLEKRKVLELKECLSKVTNELKKKREEFVDKKRLVEKLTARVEQWERKGAKIQFCEN